MIEFVISVLSSFDMLERFLFGIDYTQVVGVRYFEDTPFCFRMELATGVSFLYFRTLLFHWNDTYQVAVRWHLSLETKGFVNCSKDLSHFPRRFIVQKLPRKSRHTMQ